jgi:hypothetical protein
MLISWLLLLLPGPLPNINIQTGGDMHIIAGLQTMLELEGKVYLQVVKDRDQDEGHPLL